MITHYFFILIAAQALVSGIAIAQSSKFAQTKDLSDQSGLPTVSESLDYSQFLSQQPTSALPNDVPSVPESHLFPRAGQSVSEELIAPPTTMAAEVRQSARPERAPLSAHLLTARALPH